MSLLLAGVFGEACVILSLDVEPNRVVTNMQNVLITSATECVFRWGKGKEEQIILGGKPGAFSFQNLMFSFDDLEHYIV